MPGNKKPTKKYKPRVVLNPVTHIPYIAESVSLVQAEQITQIQDHLYTVMDRFLQEGNTNHIPNYDDWNSIRIAAFICKDLVSLEIVKSNHELNQELHNTTGVLEDIRRRFTQVEGENEYWVAGENEILKNERDQLFFFKKLFKACTMDLTVAEYSRVIARVEQQLKDLWKLHLKLNPRMHLQQKEKTA